MQDRETLPWCLISHCNCTQRAALLITGREFLQHNGLAAPAAQTPFLIPRTISVMYLLPPTPSAALIPIRSVFIFSKYSLIYTYHPGSAPTATAIMTYWFRRH